MKIIITVDANDGDYVEESRNIELKDLDEIYPLIKAIEKFKPYTVKLDSGLEFTHKHNYPFGDMLREDLGEKSPRELYEGFDKKVFKKFEKLLPYCECGFHTITSIKIHPDVKVTEILNNRG